MQMEISPTPRHFHKATFCYHFPASTLLLHAHAQAPLRAFAVCVTRAIKLFKKAIWARVHRLQFLQPAITYVLGHGFIRCDRGRKPWPWDRQSSPQPSHHTAQPFSAASSSACRGGEIPREADDESPFFHLSVSLVLLEFMCYSMYAWRQQAASTGVLLKVVHEVTPWRDLSSCACAAQLLHLFLLCLVSKAWCNSLGYTSSCI